MKGTNWKRKIILTVKLCSILMLMTGLLSFREVEAAEAEKMAWGYDENLVICTMPAEEAERRIKEHWSYNQTEGKLNPYLYYGKLPDLDAEIPDPMELVSSNWYQFKWKYAITGMYDHEVQKREGRKYKGFSDVTGVAIRVTSRGMQRASTLYGGIKNYHRDGIDFKDIRRFMSPEDTRGLSVMTWDYLDKSKDQDTFLYLPSMRKIRRVAQANKEDSFGGMDVTYFDLSLRVPGDEEHRLLRVEKVTDELINQLKKEIEPKIPGLPEDYTEQRVVNYFTTLKEKDKKCYVIESTQKLDFLSFDKRVWWIDSENFRDFRRMFYDKAGRLVKLYNISFRRTPILPDRKVYGISEDFHWVKNMLTGHRTVIYHPPMCFNNPIPDSNFTIKWLKRAH